MLDLTSAPQLAETLGLLADEGHRAIVLDLGALNFIDVRGLGAITAAIHRLRPSGGTLEIQSPSPLAHRLFTLTATDQTLILGAPRVARPAPTQPEDAAAPAWDDAPLPPSLLDAARRWNPNEMLEVALRAVVLIARVAMSGSHGLSVSLRRDDRWVTVAATDQAVMALDQVQYDHGEGPCMAAATEGSRFLVESLAEEVRWPAFTTHARECGVASVLSAPLGGDGSLCGSLNVYWESAGALTPSNQDLASVVASNLSELIVAAEASSPARLRPHLGTRSG